MKTKGLALIVRQPSQCEKTFRIGPVPAHLQPVRRRITPEAGRGLEKLGHAVDYLTDEFMRDGCQFGEDRGRVQAIQLLAGLNRQIYLSCGIEPTFRERVQTLLRRLFKQAGLQN